MDTSIKIKDQTKNKLNKLKYNLNAKSIDEVINSLLKMVSKFKMANELKDINTDERR